MDTVASSMIGVAGVVFSITIVALSLAANEFGSRLLHNFMRDKINQTVLGVFLATFLYCLLILRSIRGENGGVVPHLSVTLGIVLAICSLFFLIFYIHHIAQEIQAPHVVKAVSEELDEVIDWMFPEDVGQESDENALVTDVREQEVEDRFKTNVVDMRPLYSGYIQTVNTDSLLALTIKQDVIVKIKREPGAFVLTTDTVMKVWPCEKVDDKLIKQLRSTLVIANQRTMDQDVLHGLDQLVEVALRALSPSMNDSFTAMQCLDWLSHALIRLANKKIPSPYRRDDRGQVRVIAYPVEFQSMAYEAFTMIRQNSRNNAAVTFHLLETLRDILYHVRNPKYRTILQNHAALVYEQARRTLQEEADIKDLEERYQQVLSSQPE